MPIHHCFKKTKNKIVEVPVEVQVPIETIVEVPVEVPVEVVVEKDSSLLAVIDFSQLPDQDLSTDGVHSIGLAYSKKGLSSCNVQVAYSANLGQDGYYRIENGQLALVPGSTITSYLGTEYYSALPSCYIKLALQDLSDSFVNDVSGDNHTHQVVFEMEPMWGPAYLDLNFYEEMQVGITQGLSGWEATSAIPVSMMTYDRIVASSISSHSSGYVTRNVATNTSVPIKTFQNFNLLTTWQINTAYESFYTNYATKYSFTFSGYPVQFNVSNGTHTWGSTPNTGTQRNASSTSKFPFTNRAGNDRHVYLSCTRYGGTPNAALGHRKINKITIYERTNL